MRKATRRAARMVTLVSVASIGLAAAGPASAKGGIAITSAPRSVSVGQTFHVSASGSDDDSAEPYERACIQQRLAPSGQWHTVKCGKTVGGNAGAEVDANVKALRHGTIQFRGVLYGAANPHVKHPTQQQTSIVSTVHVR